MAVPLAVGAMAATVSALPPTPSPLEATPPERILDTRLSGQRTEPGTVITITVAGTGDVPADALAVIVNLTMDNAAGPGFLSALPGGTLGEGEAPETSNVNHDEFAAPSIANTAIVPLSDDGTIEIYTSNETEVIVDVLGYIPAGADYTPVMPPERVADTRITGAFPGDTELFVNVNPSGLAPADAAYAIVNLTFDNTEDWGFLSVAPSEGEFRAGTSSVNAFGPGQTRAGMSIVPIGDDGRIAVYQSVGGNVLVDVFGYLGSSSVTALDPSPRIVDTRVSGERFEAGETSSYMIAGVEGVPATATAIFATITADGTGGPGFVTVWPGGLDQPNTSNLNHPGGATIANTFMVPIGADGTIQVYTDAETDIIIDLIAWF